VDWLEIATTIGIVCGAIIALGGAVAVIRKLARGIWRGIKTMLRVYRQAKQFFADWFGDESTPGFPARMAAMEEQVKFISNEMRPNGGHSARDKIDRIEQRVCDKP
jgi:hypothetical protein